MRLGYKKYHGFLIDADDTIFDFSRSQKEAFLETLLTTNYTGHPENAYLKFHFISQALWKEFENAQLSASELNDQRFKLLFKALKIQSNIKTTAAFYLDTLSKKIYTLPKAISTLEYLSRRATLCLITNGLAYVQRNRIARAELEVFFKEIIISEEIGYPKPHKEFFKKAVASLQLPLHSILCVGDNLDADIKGGQQYGLDTCLYLHHRLNDPFTDPFPDYIISDLEDLKRFTPEIS